MDEQPLKKYPFLVALDKFLLEISGLSNSLPVIMQSISNDTKNTIKEIEQYLNEKGSLRKETTNEDASPKETTKEYQINLEYFQEFSQLTKKLSKAKATTNVIPKSFLVAMISQFDAFLSNLIRAMYYAEPRKLNSSKKPLTFAELVEFGSIEKAQEYILEKEVETVLRESHTFHFEWLEKKLDIPLRTNLPSWLDFIEITERRNLFVHTDGVVSSSYIENCKEQKVKIDKECVIGAELGVSKQYYQKSYEVLSEIAIKLAHVMWRKLIPEELEIADAHLSRISYDLLQGEEYPLAKKILQFALDLPRQSSQRTGLVATINLAIAYKWGDEPEKANQLISNTDWSATSIDFQLASAVLLNQYEKAASIMKKIGDDGEVTMAHYKEWPVFQDFRHSKEFQEAYTTIFGVPLETIEIPSNVIDGNKSKEYEKIILINSLEESGSFVETHSIIKQLNGHENFTESQRNKIVKAAVSNDQVYRIIKDGDVKEFLMKTIRGHEDQIEAEILAELQELLERM